MTGTLDELRVASVPDEVLMRSVCCRDKQALAELYNRHSEQLRAIINGIIHEEADTDDVLQEVYLQVWKTADRYSTKAGKPLGWMVTIARWRAIDRLRQRQAYSRARERYRNRIVLESEGVDRNPAEALGLNDLRQFLKRSIQALPRYQREAVELAFFTGLSHRKIAAITHAPVGTVKTRLQLGLRKLTHELTSGRQRL